MADWLIFLVRPAEIHTKQREQAKYVKGQKSGNLQLDGNGLNITHHKTGKWESVFRFDLWQKSCYLQQWSDWESLSWEKDLPVYWAKQFIWLKHLI